MSVSSNITKTVLAVIISFFIFSILYFFSETPEGYKASTEVILYRIVIGCLCIALFMWMMSKVWFGGKKSE